MKTILVAVVGTVGLLATPAVAGTLKTKPVAKPAVTETKAAEAPKPIAADAVAAALGAEVSPEILAIPELPADASTPFASLELRAPLMPAPLKNAKPSLKAKAPVLKMGNDYVIGSKRTAARPTEEVQQIVPRGLSQSAVTTFVQAHQDDVQLAGTASPLRSAAKPRRSSSSSRSRTRAT